MKTPEPANALQELLPLATATPDRRRLELLVSLLDARTEKPGQVQALFHSDCGLSRAYWIELQSAKANAWLGLHEALVARPREELRAWAVQQLAALAARPVPLDEVARLAERERGHFLYRALVADHLFATGWERFDPGTDTDRGVLGVRSVFDRYMLVLRERAFMTNLGVLGFAAWFRAPVEKVDGLDLEPLRLALEQRWEASARLFPAVSAPENAWGEAHRQAGEMFPTAAAVAAKLLEIERRSGLQARPSRQLLGATGGA